MITIYVKSKCDNPTLEYPEHKKIASEYIPEVWKHIQENDDVHIVTCSENVVNFIGCMIYEKKLWTDNIKLIVEEVPYFYTDDGTLMNWRYGYFLWDENENYSPDVEVEYNNGYKAGYDDAEFDSPTKDHSSKKWIDYNRGYKEGKFDVYFANDPD